MNFFEQQAEYLKVLSRLDELAGRVTMGTAPFQGVQNGEVRP